jgi:HEAT repeat protein
MRYYKTTLQKKKMSRKDWTDEKLIYRLTNNKTHKSRWENISALRKRPSEELFSKCVELTKSDNTKIRKIGIDILAQLGSSPRPFLKETLKIYFELLEVEIDPDVLMSLLYSIGHNNDELDKEQIEKICSFIDNDNSLTKEGLVSALLGIDNLTAIETLIKLSSDKLNHIRNWATFGLGTQIERNNKNIREALWERVNDKHKETKLEAIVGLAKRKDNRVNEIIKREIIDGDYGILLFEAILETKDKEFLPLLNQNLKLIKNDTNINSEWEKDLKNCINELIKLTNEKRTIA